uniref:guanylate cyclase n=1 Tax=Macrostomum lignano TaxID=282301 RepID=A0A1I8GHI0_9PLAT
MSKDELYEMFGRYFFKYFKRHGYDKMIYTLGQDLKKFIRNLDSLHDYLQIDNKGMVPPSFSVIDMGDVANFQALGRSPDPDPSGMLSTVAKEIFGTEIQLKVLNIETDFPAESRYRTHAKLLITFSSTGSLAVSLEDYFQPWCPAHSHITVRSFIRHFPYHIVFDEQLLVRQSGVGIQTVCHALRSPSEPVRLTDVCDLVNPPVAFTASFIRRFLNSAFTLLLRRGPEETSPETSLLLKGQMIHMDDTQLFLFFCSPRVLTLCEMMEKRLCMSDLPLYDVTRELLQVNQQRLAEIGISRQLDEMTYQMRRMTAELEVEKQKTYTLLSQMLPAKVAKQLLDGKKVKAEKYDICTILFSDIVTFTDIASQCTPMDVVDMLNSLYSLFDHATEVNRVYKVETIGDAYMVVGGVPERTVLHAELVCEQAMDMLEAAGKVCSPVTKKPLQVRIGIHTGPTVAGVVGDKMPRFCLFGDTVNVASRMESHGLPNRVHVSPEAHE